MDSNEMHSSEMIRFYLEAWRQGELSKTQIAERLRISEQQLDEVFSRLTGQNEKQSLLG